MSTDMTAGHTVLSFRHVALALEVHFHPITQGMLNAWHAALRQTPPAAEISVSEYHGHLVRAALVAGWIASPAGWTPDQVDGWDPVKVRWLARQILTVHKELTTVPPE